jgi:hypothetical protein
MNAGVFLAYMADVIVMKPSPGGGKRRKGAAARKGAVALALNFEEKLREHAIGKLMGTLGEWDEKSATITARYARLLMTDRKQAIDSLPQYITEARSICGNMAYESMAGGPNQDWVVPFFNLVGDVYPQMDWHQRSTFLEHCMNYFNGLRYDYSQNHVELIHEPWLVGDIIVTNWLYWCGHAQHTAVLEKYRKWNDFVPAMDNTPSAFWMAFAITRSDGEKPRHASAEVQDKFYKHYPHLTDRTIDVIAAMMETRACDERVRKGATKEQFIEQKLQGYDPRLHKRVYSKIAEHKWIQLEQR